MADGPGFDSKAESLGMIKYSSDAYTERSRASRTFS